METNPSFDSGPWMPMDAHGTDFPAFLLPTGSVTRVQFGHLRQKYGKMNPTLWNHGY
jgi:hypothetical protein